MYINSKGKKVLRVSSIIKSLAVDELIFWANYLGFKRVSYKKELEGMANIGSMIHDIIYRINSPKKLVSFNWNEFDIYQTSDMEQVYNGVESYKKWLNKNSKNIKFKHHEYTIIGEKYGGTIDTIIESIFDKDALILCDYKTSKDFRLSHFIQLAGYVLLCEKERNWKIDGVMVILIDKKNGKIAKERIIRRDDLLLFIALFEHLYAVTVINKKLNVTIDKIYTNLEDM